MFYFRAMQPVVQPMLSNCTPVEQPVVTHSVSIRRRETAKCIVVTRVSVCVCLSRYVRDRMPTLLHGPGCHLGSGRGCPLVVHYWADLQSGHVLRCYGNITRTRNVSEYMPVLALCLGQSVGGFTTSCKQTFNRLSNRLNNRLNLCLHDAAGCSTGLTTGCIV